MRTEDSRHIAAEEILPTEQDDATVLYHERITMLKDGFLQLLSDNYAFKIFILLSFFLNKLHADPKHSAASGLSINYLNFFLISVISFLFGIAPSASQLFVQHQKSQNISEKDAIKAKIVSSFQHGFLFACVIATPFVMAALYAASWVFKMQNQNEEVSEIAADTLKQIAWMVPPTFLSLLLGQFFVAARKTNIMLAGMGSLVIGLSTAVMSGFGLLGFPKKDVDGVLASYNAEAYLNAAIYSFYITYHKDFREFEFFQSLIKNPAFEKSAMADFFKNGLPQFIRLVSELSLSYLLSAYAVRFGVDRQAGLAIAMQSTLPNSIVAIQFALTGMSGVAHAREHYENNDAKKALIYKIGKTGILLTSAISLMMPLVLFFVPNTMNIFYPNQDNTVKDTVTTITPYMAGVSALEGMTFAVMLQTQVLNHPFGPTIARCISIALGYPIGIALSEHNNVTGLTLGMMCASFLSLLSNLAYWSYDIHVITKKEGDKNTASFGKNLSASLFGAIKKAISTPTPTPTNAIEMV